MVPRWKKMMVVLVLLAFVPWFAACSGSLVAGSDDEGDSGESTEFALNDVDLAPVAGPEMAMASSCIPGWDGCPE